MNINDLIKDFKDFEDIRPYIESQFKTITVLTKENTSLKEEIKHLKSMLMDSVPIIGGQTAEITNEEQICLTEIKKLKDLTEIQVLTYEDTKKLDIFVKTLKLLREKTKKSQPDVSGLSEKDLLSSIENE